MFSNQFFKKFIFFAHNAYKIVEYIDMSHIDTVNKLDKLYFAMP